MRGASNGSVTSLTLENAFTNGASVPSTGIQTEVGDSYF